ncbi:MAG: fumarylacetoacetate hydrolase family protein [Myxococcota bacterium]
MKLVQFEGEGGPSFGLYRDDGVVDLRARLPYTDMNALLADPEGLASARQHEDRAADISLSAISKWLPPVTRPSKIFCIGVNYDEHRKETGRAVSSYPTVFARFAHTLVGHQQPLIRPDVSDRFDFEGELAVIMGRGGRRIAADDALKHIAGYACFNDASVRDYQKHTAQITPGKNFDQTGGLGPWLLTADEVADPAALHLETRIGREVMQSAPTDQMIFSIPVLIEYLSSFCTLVPGDLIATGTPSGVGDQRTPPRYMKPGETVSVHIKGVGMLENPIAAEDVAHA